MKNQTQPNTIGHFIKRGFSKMSSRILVEMSLAVEQALGNHLSRNGFTDESVFVLVNNNISIGQLCKMSQDEILNIPGMSYNTFLDIKAALNDMDVETALSKTVSEFRHEEIGEDLLDYYRQ